MQQQAPAAAAKRGIRVYLDYTQSELDAAYDQACYAPNQPQLQDRRVAASEAVRQRLGNPERFAYGESEIEKLDVFRTRRPNAPIFVFIHGGAWRNGVAKDHCYAAESFVLAGVNYVVPDFVLVQDAGGSLLPIADQVRRAIAWAYKNAERFGGDKSRFYIGGHSSGAHLAGCALIADWEKDWGVPGDFIKGATLCSGMYDLVPVRLSARSNYVSFTDEMVEKLSAIRHIDKLRAPITLVCGTKETPEFQRQPRDFAAAVKAAGKPVELLVGQHYNHFEIGETFANPFGLCGRAALDQIGVKLVPA
jgi:arylformamidase